MDSPTQVVQRNTIAATKSLRPRDFQRQTLVKEQLKDDHELFLQKNIPTLKHGTFFQVHTACQQEDLDRLITIYHNRFILVVFDFC